MEGQKLCDSIALFYKLNSEKGKSYTYSHYKDCGLSRAGIYKILHTFDQRGNVNRKAGSGRPHTLSKKDKSKLLKDITHIVSILSIFCDM